MSDAWRQAADGMPEPNFWNPLPFAADWLSQATGRRIDVRGLVDLVATPGKMGPPDPTPTEAMPRKAARLALLATPGMGKPDPTIIKAVIPRTARFALLAMHGHPACEVFLSGQTHARLCAAFGDLPRGLAYIREVRIDVIPLCVNHLLELLMRGEVPVSLEFTGSGDEIVWMMPLGSQHMATVETCGVNRADLIDLARSINKARAKPTETVSDRDARWLSVLENELTTGAKHGAMTRATKHIEQSEGVKADTVKKGIGRARKLAKGAEVGVHFKGLLK